MNDLTGAARRSLEEAGFVAANAAARAGAGARVNMHVGAHMHEYALRPSHSAPQIHSAWRNTLDGGMHAQHQLLYSSDSEDSGAENDSAFEHFDDANDTFMSLSRSDMMSNPSRSECDVALSRMHEDESPARGGRWETLGARMHDVHAFPYGGRISEIQASDRGYAHIHARHMHAPAPGSGLTGPGNMNHHMHEYGGDTRVGGVRGVQEETAPGLPSVNFRRFRFPESRTFSFSDGRRVSSEEMQSSLHH